MDIVRCVLIEIKYEIGRNAITVVIHLIVDLDRADDHLPRLLLLHIVQAERVDLGGEVATHLVRPTKTKRY